MIRDITRLLEKAEIMEDRIQYAHQVLKYDKTKQLSQELTGLLNGEETTHNCDRLKEFVQENETTIHAFDVEAMDIISVKQAEIRAQE